MKLEYDVDGGPAEICEAEEVNGICDDCEQKKLVIRWYSKISDWTYQVCREDLVNDDFARLVP
jgi:hypothetical protein